MACLELGANATCRLHIEFSQMLHHENPSSFKAAWFSESNGLSCMIDPLEIAWLPSASTNSSPVLLLTVRSTQNTDYDKCRHQYLAMRLSLNIRRSMEDCLDAGSSITFRLCSRPLPVWLLALAPRIGPVVKSCPIAEI